MPSSDYYKDHLAITISDNGTGFSKDLLSVKDGQGLQNILSRAKMIGGSAEINSQPGNGTSIIITSPYE